MLQLFSTVLAIVAVAVFTTLLVTFVMYFGVFLAGLMAVLGSFVTPRLLVGRRG